MNNAFIYETGEVVTVISRDKTNMFGSEYTIMYKNGTLRRNVCDIHPFFSRLPIVLKSVEQVKMYHSEIERCFKCKIHLNNWVGDIKRGIIFLQGAPNCGTGYLSMWKTRHDGICGITCYDGDDLYIRKNYTVSMDMDADWCMIIENAPVTFKSLEALGFYYY